MNRRPLHVITVMILTPALAITQTVAIPSPVSCATCSIVLRPHATIRGAEFRGPSGSIARGMDGTIFLVDNSDGIVKAFDPSGRFVKAIGRKGGGPGEYEKVIDIGTDRNAQLHLFDAVLARWSVFGLDGTYRTSKPLPAYNIRAKAVLVRGDDGLVVNTPHAGAAGSSSSLTLVDQRGQTVRAIDVIQGNPRMSWLFERRLCAMPGGGFLAVHPYTFAFDLYSAAGDKVGSFVRVADWVPRSAPTQLPSDGVFERPLDAFIMDVWSDANGLVWISALVPSNRWSPVPHPERGRMPSRDSLFALAARPRAEAIVEVIDLQKQAVVARAKFDRPIGVVFADGYVARDEPDSADEPLVRISRLQLQRR